MASYRAEMMKRRFYFVVLIFGIFFAFLWLYRIFFGTPIPITAAIIALTNNPVLDEIENNHGDVKIEWPKQMPNPGHSYPLYDNLFDIIKEWNPDVPDPPPVFKETLQHFNYSCPKEREMAMRYLEAELPFKVYGVPEFDDVVLKWTDHYLASNLGNYKVEKSKDNHFMFWNAGTMKHVKDYTPPTKHVRMDFIEWLAIAKAADSDKLPASVEHFYLTTGVPPRDTSTMIGRDLVLFSTKKNNFFIRDVNLNKGIQCRFGMRGVIAESHYDAGRNMVAMLKGRKRYILTPPETCNKLGIIADKKHPSFRHSVLDWSDLTQAAGNDFATVKAVDTIINPGEVLYIPSFWFHYIMSMEYSIQCNSRHGSPPSSVGKDYINKCLHHDV